MTKYNLIKVGDKYAVRERVCFRFLFIDFLLENDGYVDLLHPNFTWRPHNFFYRDCFGTYEEANKVYLLKTEKQKVTVIK